MSSVYPVIMSGGSGSRLWPLSRQYFPKQFLSLASEKTMIQETASRMSGFLPPIVVCNENHRFIVAEQFQSIGIKATSIMLEPVARNTAPAIALAAFEAVNLNSEAILVVLAADHVIGDAKGFKAAVEEAVEYAENGDIITFGITPTRPETGFGYIQSAGEEKFSDILRFVEKPDSETAKQYLESGDYSWNSGMFVFKASVFLGELEKYKPDMFSFVKSAFSLAEKDLDFTRIPKEPFEKVPSDSIDYAVMENTTRGKVRSLDVDWHDVGSFSALWGIKDKDDSGNVNIGDVKNFDTRNCLVDTEGQFVATLGVSDLIVVATKDSVLVAHKNNVQDVKKVVEFLGENGRTEHLLHREVHRPWGKYDSIDNGSRYQVKRITVKPGASLSKQMHHHRAEHWIVVSGTAVVEIDDQQRMLTENQSVYIPLGSVHRLTNPGKLPLELIEVQSGSYLGEDDIVRFEDVFGRC